MPELPDLTVYAESLETRLVGRVLERLQILNPFLLRTAVPPIAEAAGQRIVGIERLGKRIVVALAGERFLVIHLMIAGRLRWLAPKAKPPARLALAVFTVEGGQLVLTEAGTTRRASLHFVAGREALAALDAGGLEPLALDAAAFQARLVLENRTLKRALTDPRIFAGIGNAYSDEILHRARLSPTQLTRQLDAAEQARLHAATREVLQQWTARLRAEAAAAGGWPPEVTAFRDGMAVHGRYRQPCPDCGAPVQRIVHGDHETNYCARCQTGGRLLADRALSTLLKADWPKRLDDLEAGPGPKA